MLQIIFQRCHANYRKIFIFAGILFAFSVADSEVLFAGWDQGFVYYPGGHMIGSGHMGWMMILFWALLLILLVLVVRWVLRLSQSNSDSQTALDILKKRLASGEIDIKEFEEKKQFL